MGGAVKAITKPIKKVVKSVSKVVKKVAKTVVNVGKKVVKGVKSAVKGVGKAVGKLGPVASIALMAVGGYFLSPMLTPMWNTIGISSKIGLAAANGALTGFVASGGDIKAAALGGITAGAGSAVGSYVSGGAQGLSQAWASQAPTTLAQGWQEVGQRWSSFTDTIANTGKTVTEGIGDYFDKLGGGDTAKGAEFAFSPDATKAQQINATMDSIKAMGGTNEMISANMELAGSNQLDQFQSLKNLEASLKTDISGTAGFTKDIYATEIAKTGEYVSTGPTATNAIGQPLEGVLQGGEQFRDPYWQVARDYNVAPGSAQHLQLLEQDYGQYQGSLAAWDPAAGKITTTSPNLMEPGKFTFDQQQSFFEPNVRQMQFDAFSESTTPEYMTKPMETSLLDKGKTAMDALSKGYQAWSAMQKPPTGTGTTPSWVTSVPAGDTLLGKAGGIGGAGGTFIGTAEQEQYQRNLVAAIKQQEEMAKQRAQAGWGIA